MSPDSKPDFFRSLIESSPDITAVIDDSGRVVYASPAAAKLLGRTDPVGTSFLDVVHPEDLPRVRQSFQNAVSSPAFEGEDEVRVRASDGEYRWVQSLGRRLDRGPAAGHFLIQLRDVTARRSAENRLREVEQRLRRVADGLPMILFAVDRAGVFTLSEGRGLKLLGTAPGEAVGSNVFDRYADVPLLADHVRRALGGEPVRYRVEVAERIWDTQLEPVHDEQEGVIGALGVSLDVTEAARRDRATAFQALLLDSIGQVVVATDRDGRVTYWNRAATAMLGWSRSEAIGRPLEDLVLPSDRHDQSVPRRAAILRGEEWTGELRLTGRSGETIPALVTGRPLVEDGEIVGVIGVASDLREVKRLEEQLRQAQKMEAVGQLAGGVAHDFNNILTAIGGYAGMAADRSTDPQVSADIAEVVRATERARALVAKLLAFSRRGRVVPRSLDVNRVVRELLPLLRRTIPAEVRLEEVLAPDVWPVRSDQGQLEQALINLVVNARDAMPDGGTLTIRTDKVELDRKSAREIAGDLEPGAYVRITVQDTGVGMDDEVRSRIFEPFFTTKPVGKGTGLGLSTVFGAVRHLGGGIEVASREGEGSRFTLYLPRSEQDPEAPESTPTLPDGPATAARILLVEDEPAVRRLTQRILSRAGYEVTEAETGLEALRKVEAGERPDLVITDVIMPEMGGGELADRLRGLLPNARVLFISGYTADELGDRGIESTAAFLPKPFPPDVLLERVRQVLGGTPA